VRSRNEALLDLIMNVNKPVAYKQWAKREILLELGEPLPEVGIWNQTYFAEAAGHFKRWYAHDDD